MKIIVTEKNFNETVIGRKAENLFLMQKSGFNVPEFFCIDADFFDEQSYDTAERILEKELFDYFSQNEINEELFSVRSSALCEDSEHHSFAGQYDTFLNVKKENLVKKIIECHSSVKNESVLRYLQENDIKIENLKMAIIVQKMICADISGVVFSANPQGILNEAVIVAGEGTGNNVVEEKVPVTSYYFNRTDKKYYYEQMNNSLLLDNEIVYELIEISEQLEKLFGKYVDVEFAIKNRDINILQCRPITTISDETPLIFDNSNIVESYPGITLPLTASFIEEAYYGVFKGAAYRVLKSKRLTMRYEPILHNMIGSANGRIYYKISNWYSVIKFLPFSKKIIPIWQDMMGVTIKEHSEDDNDLNGFRKFITYISAFHEALHVQSNMKALNERFSSVVKMFDSKFPKAESIKALHEIYCRISDMVLKSWDITLLNDMYAFIYTGLLKKKLGDEVKTNKFISEISNIESLKPIKGIVNLSFDAINEDIIEELSELETDEDVRKYLEGKTGEFVNCFKKYIKNYGDRVPEELKLETVTFRVSPILLVKQIVDYATDGHRLCQTNSNLKGKMFFDFNTYNED